MRLTAALLALAVSVGAASDEPSPAVLAGLSELRQALLEDRAPPTFEPPPSGLSPDDARALAGLSARISHAQAGRLGFYIGKDGREVPDAGASGVELIGELRALAGKLQVDEQTLYARYKGRRCPAPSRFRLYVQAACKEAQAGSFGGSVFREAREELGPVADQLRSAPQGPVRLPVGHPLFESDARVTPCATGDAADASEKRPPAALRLKLSRDWEAEASKLTGASVQGEIRGLVELASRQAEEAERGRKQECRHEQSSSDCREYTRLAADARARQERLEGALECLEKPETCGGLLCGFYSACSLPRALTAHAIAEADYEDAKNAHAAHPSPETQEALRKAEKRRDETEIEAATEMAVLATAILGPLQAPVKVLAKALVKPAVRWIIRAGKLERSSAATIARAPGSASRVGAAEKKIAAAESDKTAELLTRARSSGLQVLEPGRLSNRAIMSVDHGSSAQFERALLDGSPVVVKSGPGALREAAMLKRVNDAGVGVRLRGVVVDGSKAGLVMDAIDGAVVRAEWGQLHRLGARDISKSKDLIGYGVGEKTFAHVRESARRLDRAGIVADDFQGLVTKSGDFVVIDVERYRPRATAPTRTFPPDFNAREAEDLIAALKALPTK